MGKDEVNRFLSHLALTERVSASTQSQALNAIRRIYRRRPGRRGQFFAGWGRFGSPAPPGVGERRRRTSAWSKRARPHAAEARSLVKRSVRRREGKGWLRSAFRFQMT